MSVPSVPSSLALLPLALLLCQCSPRTAAPPARIEPAATPALAAPYGFDIALALSPKARALLAARKEKVVAAAMYYGSPNAAGKAKADEVGQIDMGADRPQADAVDGTIHITGSGLDKSALGDIDGEPMVLVNVYSARLSGPDNLLDCGIFEDTIRKARAAPVAIACKLIDEGDMPARP